MRRRFIVWAIAVSCGMPAFAGKKPAIPTPEQFEVGLRTFFDFGPPFNYYDIFVVRPREHGASVEKIALTPSGDACLQPAKVELVTAELPQSVSQLFAGTNPCAIPEKELRRERKRCKNCARYSGADVSMRVQCGAATRILKANVLESDWFDKAPNTPEHTSWAMQLLGKLEQATGPGPLDKPMFAVDEGSGEQGGHSPTDSPTIHSLAAGEFDDLFQGSRDKPSDLYRDSLQRPPAPSITLASGSPVAPENPALPKYPPLARLAHIQGKVVLDLVIGADGNVTGASAVSGHPMLVPAAKESAMHWKFPSSAAGQTARAEIAFGMNCPERDQK